MTLPVRALAEADEELDHAIGHYEIGSRAPAGAFSRRTLSYSAT